MPEYICNKCNKIFNKKSNYEKHINKKFDCIKLNHIDNLCNFCNKIFVNKYTLQKHISNNICNEKLLSKINKLENKIKNLEKSKEIINVINNSTTNNNQTINNIINNQTINIVKFGIEDYKYLLNNEDITNILSKGYKALEESILTTHFNNKYPEYKNIYISDKKFKYANIYDGDKFILEDCNKVILDLINNHTTNIEEYLLMQNIKISPVKLIKIKELINYFYSCEKICIEKKDKIINEIKLLLYNNRNKIV